MEFLQNLFEIINSEIKNDSVSQKIVDKIKRNHGGDTIYINIRPNDEIIRGLKSGLGIRELATRFRVTPKTIKRIQCQNLGK